MFGGGTKPAKYCKLSTYLQHNAKTLYDNIQDLCMFSVLNARRGRGVTLILPEEKLQKQIDKMVGVEPLKAVDMIKSLIIPKFVTSLGDLKSVETLAGTQIPVDEGKSDATTLVLEGKGKISVDDKFERLHEDSNIACFKLSGSLYTGDGVDKVSDDDKKTGSGNTIGAYTRGGYTGGNDDFKERYNSVANNMGLWRDNCAILKAQIGIYVKNGSLGIDPLTHTTVSMLEWLKKENRQQYDFLCAVNPCSPLYCLFLGDLLCKKYGDGFTWGNSAGYDKKEVLGEQVKLDKNRLKAVRAVKTEIKQKLFENGEVLGKVKEVINASVVSIGYGGLFDGEDECHDWVASMQEFCYYFTVEYIRNIRDKSNLIIDMFKNNICDREYASRYLFIKHNPKIHTHYSKEYFCATLSFYVNDACGSCGLDWDAPKSGSKDGVTYGWGKDVRPDGLTPTSYQGIVAEFWGRV